jgi:cell division septation protein DedD
MRASLKSRIIGSFVVLVALAVVALLVLHRKQDLPEKASVDSSMQQTLSLPGIEEEPSTAWHAKQSQQEESPAEVVEDIAPPSVQAPAQPTLKPKPVLAKPRSVKKVAPVQCVTLQVASYQSAKNADIMQARLHSLGYKAHIQKLRIQGKTWYRLTAGPFASQKQAQQAQRILQRKWKIRARIRVAR